MDAVKARLTHRAGTKATLTLAALVLLVALCVAVPAVGTIALVLLGTTLLAIILGSIWLGLYEFYSKGRP